MTIELYNDGSHVCVAFEDLVHGEAVQANLASGDLTQPVTDFDAIVPFMEGFHSRYMNSNKICRLWANMVRSLDVEWIVPQHGRSFKGKEVVARFLSWIEELPCGIDLMSQANYRVP